MSSTLSTALTGLRIAQQQMTVISTNVSNVGTPGYTRKILPQSVQAVDGIGIGVQAETIIRNVDVNLTRDLWTQVSSVGKLEVKQTYLQRVEQFHGPPNKELSIAAEIARLRDSFSILSDSPEDNFLLTSTVNQAVDTANKINEFSNLITTLRNDAQGEIQDTVNRINGLLEQIAEINDQVQISVATGRTIAQLEDERDTAIQELSQLIEISFFQRGDGVIVVQTSQGVELASNTAQTLTFDGSPLSAGSYYPESVAGVFVDDPLTNPQAVDITTTGVGGKLGGLLELRDETFPKQMAQLDELAHKMALRFEAQGLRLFTDQSGSIPLDTAPDATTLPDPTPVSYVGFSAIIQVNNSILNDNSLIQSGTYGANPQTGSNEIIRRVLENTFGSVDFQQATNTVAATQVDLLNRGPGIDMQEWLGLFSTNSVQGGRDLTTYADVGAIVTAANGDLTDPNDQFQINISETRNGLGTMTLTVDLSVANLAAGANAAEQLVNHINTLIATEVGATPVFAGFDAVASVGINGELTLSTRGSYEIDSNFGATGVGQDGLDFLGLVDNNGTAVAPTDPFFDIAVGNNDPTRITIEPGDTDVELLAKLDAVPGLAVDTVNFAIDGILRLRPGNDFDNPDFGGDITITSGPFVTDGAAYGAPPALSARGAMDDGVNVVSALFGSYSISGTDVQDTSPITNNTYGSETNGSLTPPIPTLSFRETLLGPGANISSNIVGALALIDFSQKMVNEHAQELILTQDRIDDEETLQFLLQDKLNNESGVNIDEEMGNLIVVQNAYSASARVLTAVNDLFQELLNIFR